MSALSALPCCSLNDNKKVSLDDAVSSGLIVSVLSSYHSVSWGYRLSRICNQICTKGPSSHDHHAQKQKLNKDLRTLLSLQVMMGLSVNIVTVPVDLGTSNCYLSQYSYINIYRLWWVSGTTSKSQGDH